MKITNAMRAKYPTLNDEQIVDVVSWNRYITKCTIKDICRYAFGTLCIAMIALLSASAIAGIVSMIYNCFII